MLLRRLCGSNEIRYDMLCDVYMRSKASLIYRMKLKKTENQA